MLIEWTPGGLAKLSIGLMAIPALLTVLAVLVSIFIGFFLEKLNISKESDLSLKLYKASGNIFYVAYISVIVMNLTAVGLIASGFWAVIELFIK